MPGDADRVTHVVQTVEEADQVVFVAELRSTRNLERHATSEVFGRGGSARRLDRTSVEIEPGDGRLRKRLRHDRRGVAEPTPDIGNASAGLGESLGMPRSGCGKVTPT